jgi:Flp pilus assembly protein TadB
MGPSILESSIMNRATWNRLRNKNKTKGTREAMNERDGKILALYLLSTGVFFILIGLLLSPLLPLLWWLLVLVGATFCVFSIIYLIRSSKRKGLNHE